MTTRDPRRMIRDAAEFDRRQTGIRPYSEREMREALEMRSRLRRRDDRILAAFETHESRSAPLTGVSSRSALGGALGIWPTIPAPSIFDLGSQCSIYVCKGRGATPDHPSSGIGLGAVSGTPSGTGAFAVTTPDSDGDCIEGTCDAAETITFTMAGFAASQLTRTGAFYASTKLKTGASVAGCTFWPIQLGNPSVDVTVGDPANSARNIAGIVFRQGTDTNWQLYACSNADATGAYTDTGVAVSTQVLYVCELFGDANGVYARISTNAATGSITSYTGAKLPATGTALNSNAWGWISASATRTLRWYGTTIISR